MPLGRGHAGQRECPADNLLGVDFQEVVRRRRMVRSYDVSRPVPAELVDRIVGNGLRAPSAGFSQGWGFLVLDTPA
jgi:nitroreductase